MQSCPEIEQGSEGLHVNYMAIGLHGHVAIITFHPTLALPKNLSKSNTPTLPEIITEVDRYGSLNHPCSKYQTASSLDSKLPDQPPVPDPPTSASSILTSNLRRCLCGDSSSCSSSGGSSHCRRNSCTARLVELFQRGTRGATLDGVAAGFRIKDPWTKTHHPSGQIFPVPWSLRGIWVLLDRLSLNSSGFDLSEVSWMGMPSSSTWPVTRPCWVPAGIWPEALNEQGSFESPKPNLGSVSPPFRKVGHQRGKSALPSRTHGPTQWFETRWVRTPWRLETNQDSGIQDLSKGKALRDFPFTNHVSQTRPARLPYLPISWGGSRGVNVGIYGIHGVVR